MMRVIGLETPEDQALREWFDDQARRSIERIAENPRRSSNW
jgi:hypothetical protein